MPTVTIFTESRTYLDPLAALVPGLRTVIADLLGTPQWSLVAETISVRILACDAAAMIAPVEVEMLAAAFPERVARQDEICNAVREHLMGEDPSLPQVRVWLALCELGHSW